MMFRRGIIEERSAQKGTGAGACMLSGWVLGACRGKRSGVFGAFLLAVYNPEGEEFQTISKIGTGFSEEQLKQFSEELRLHTIPTAKPYYRCAHATHFCSPMSTSDTVSVL